MARRPKLLNSLDGAGNPGKRWRTAAPSKTCSAPPGAGSPAPPSSLTAVATIRKNRRVILRRTERLFEAPRRITRILVLRANHLQSPSRTLARPVRRGGQPHYHANPFRDRPTPQKRLAGNTVLRDDIQRTMDTESFSKCYVVGCCMSATDPLIGSSPALGRVIVTPDSNSDEVP